jgi:hypothetical protein
MRSIAILSGSLLCALVCAAACGGSRPGYDFSGGDAGNGSSGGFGDSGMNQNGPALIYAHSDTELYSMDPTTHVLTDIGAFTLAGGTTPTITDLAVDGNDNVWVNSETAIYRAALPATTGPVTLTLQTQLPSGTKFYALGFTPAGTLETGESLIAGDSAGDLYYVDVTGASTTPQNLGGFGAASGGGTWELSGDVVFYSSNGATLGLATIRECTSSCNAKDDSLAQIDIAALQQAYTSKTPAPTLLKQLIGGGTGFGDLFGIGAWGNSVYAFSRASSTGSTPAQLVQVGSTGTGVSLQSFANITSGWSGAGVTTKAPISVVQ